MLSKRIKGETSYLAAPRDWDKEENGPCSGLSVRQIGAFTQSAWEPSPVELEALNNGGLVLLTVIGDQPPMALDVEMPE